MNQFLHHYRLNHDHQQNENHLHLLNKNHMIRYHHHQIKNQIYVNGEKKRNQIKSKLLNLLIKKSSNIHW
jgi:hypothetical protein